MPGSEGPIARQWFADDGERTGSLDRARLCASLCDPAILPPRNQNPEQKLPENFQSIGSQGMLNMEGKMLSALFPPGQPWFHLEVAAVIRYDPKVAPELIQNIDAQLYLRELAIQAVLESANLGGVDERGGKLGFRTAKRMSIADVLVTGESLEQLTDDYRMKSYRRDAYVTNRDPCGDVRYHIIKESVDPLALDEDVFAKTGLRMEDVKEKAIRERIVDLYTKAEWQPRTKVWKITQECNGNTVNESTEEVSPFFCTPFRLAHGENYGRGFIELNLGDIRSLNEMEKRLLELAHLISKGLIAKDYASEIRDSDLEKSSGGIIQARVVGGVVQDVGMVRFDGVREAGFMMQSIEAKTRRLGKAMLMESDSQPTGERVTAFQVSRIAQELEGILGGAYTPIADMQQQPLLRRCIYQMVRDKILKPLPPQAVKINTLTGIAAIVRAAKRGGLMEFVQAATALGPAAMARIDDGVLMNALARYESIDEPGLVKSDERLAKDQKAALGQQAAAIAVQQAIQSSGKIAEQNAQPQAA